MDDYNPEEAISRYDVTPRAARKFFEKVGSETIHSWTAAEGKMCPLGCLLKSQGAPHPGVVRAYWSEDYSMPLTGKWHELDPVLGDFVSIIDSSRYTWNSITGEQALELLDRAERERR